MYQQYLNELQTSIAPLSSDELKELLNDDDKLNEKVDEVLESLKAQKNTFFEENREKAEQNIEKEPQIIELRGKVTELTEEGRTLCQAVQEKLTQLKEKSGGVSQETALALLQTAAAESEEQTENLVKKFTDNEVPVEAFVDEFLASRRSMHLRKLKAEKMQELMRKQAQGPSPRPAYGNVVGPGGGSGFYPAHTASVPYPIMGPIMPMPPRPF